MLKKKGKKQQSYSNPNLHAEIFVILLSPPPSLYAPGNCQVMLIQILIITLDPFFSLLAITIDHHLSSGFLE